MSTPTTKAQSPLSSERMMRSIIAAQEKRQTAGWAGGFRRGGQRLVRRRPTCSLPQRGYIPQPRAGRDSGLPWVT